MIGCHWRGARVCLGADEGRGQDPGLVDLVEADEAVVEPNRPSANQASLRFATMSSAIARSFGQGTYAPEIALLDSCKKTKEQLSGAYRLLAS